MGKLLHEELSRSIIGAAMTVLNELTPGLEEKIYENALLLELVARGHRVKQQDEFPVYYREQKVGVLIPDLIVNDLVIADPKVVSAFNESHIAKMVGYLTITNLQLALLLNFKFAKLDVKRVVRQHHSIDGPRSDVIEPS